MVNQYAYQIESMTWSYSRLRTYEDCGYGFFLKYLNAEEESRHFYAEFGSLIHRILERWYNNSVTKNEALRMFSMGFVLEVTEDVKPSISRKYYEQGKEYISSLSKLNEKIVGVEEHLSFEVGGYPFVGYVDLLLEDEGLIVTDHKSRILKPRSFDKKTKTEQKSIEELDKFLVQLYLYSVGVEQKYGRLPKELRFNCFRNGTVVTEQFDNKKYEQAKSWAIETIEKIKHETEWRPQVEWFKCRYICGFTKVCEYCRMEDK